MITRSLIAPFKHVWSLDEALDTKHPSFDHAAFCKTGDFKHLPTHEGQTLTIFECAQLTRRQREAVATLITQDQPIIAAREAVAYGLRGWTGFLAADGSELQPKFKGSDNDRRADERTIDDIYDSRLIFELGSRIIEASKLHPKNGQG
jgi:hypothetical protein